jgi:hypothetical protein
MGHLDRKRQGLDSTTAAPTVPSTPHTIIPTDSYENDIAELTTSPDTDLIIYTKLITTTDFEILLINPDTQVPVAGNASWSAEGF